jgi:hypothetical protein
MHNIKLIIIIIIMKTLSCHGPKRTILTLKGNNSRLFCCILSKKTKREGRVSRCHCLSWQLIGGGEDPNKTTAKKSGSLINEKWNWSYYIARSESRCRIFMSDTMRNVLWTLSQIFFFLNIEILTPDHIVCEWFLKGTIYICFFIEAGNWQATVRLLSPPPPPQEPW